MADQTYWGYASGVVATALAQGMGQVVLAEETRPFDQSDIAYFQPLMAQTVATLGFHPRYGAWDAAFDAFYVYDAFHEAGGFAAFFLIIDIAFLGANIIKIPQGGWVPLVLGVIVFTLMTTWKRGEVFLQNDLRHRRCPLPNLPNSSATRIFYESRVPRSSCIATRTERRLRC